MVKYVGLRLEKVFATAVQCETYSCKSLTLAHRKYSLGFGHKLLNLAEQLQSGYKCGCKGGRKWGLNILQQIISRKSLTSVAAKSYQFY